MGNSLRCCLACVLPFGAFDLIRVVHLNGHIEEYGRPITAREILAVHPNHVLTKPCSDQGVPRWIAILSPDSELKRGHIYFLVPATSVPEKNANKSKVTKKHVKIESDCNKGRTEGYDGNLYLEEKTGHHRRRSSRLSDWRPNLDCINEDTCD